MSELDSHDEAEDDPDTFQEGFGQEGLGELDEAFTSMMREFQRAKLRAWFVRTAIGALLFGYLASQYGWARWILYIWIPLAILSLLAILFLPKVLQNKVNALMQGGMEPGQNPFGAAFGGGFDEGPEDPIDVEGEVIDVETKRIED